MDVLARVLERDEQAPVRRYRKIMTFDLARPELRQTPSPLDDKVFAT